jgi:hypothetical protein
MQSYKINVDPIWSMDYQDHPPSTTSFVFEIQISFIRLQP